MKYAALLCSLVAGCSDQEAEMLAEMSPPERASYAAIKSFNRCMVPHVEAAKKTDDLSDQQISELGHKCPNELEQVAQAMAKRPLASFHGSISRDKWIADSDARIEHYRVSFADSFGCKLRLSDCPVL